MTSVRTFTPNDIAHISVECGECHSAITIPLRGQDDRAAHIRGMLARHTGLSCPSCDGGGDDYALALVRRTDGRSPNLEIVRFVTPLVEVMAATPRPDVTIRLTVEGSDRRDDRGETDPA